MTRVSRVISLLKTVEIPQFLARLKIIFQGMEVNEYQRNQLDSLKTRRIGNIAKCTLALSTVYQTANIAYPLALQREY